ncbi:NmrA family NAD(P)-binding protein [Rothia uropygialis]|uniref:NmrA family NAD(P)-binding protein n=1 Tax=Kocuria sp. 36 TaxID=1415402 RepID=UPI00101B5A95|nr:NmrA family NAD(P)-binding protein [Kocuria sp. 36]
MTKKTVLLIGATGSLGDLIAHELRERGAALRLLVRARSRSKLSPEIAEYAESIVEDDPSVFEGVDTVVSAVQGADETLVNQQLRWLLAARQAGVRRFIPSDFSMNFFGLDDGENIHSDFRREFARQADENKGDVEMVHVLNGGFLDRGVLFGFLGAVDLDKSEAYLWGEGNHAMEFTTFADTAAYTAVAALDDRPVPEHLYVAGDRLNFHELVAEIEAGLGREITVINNGSLDDLSAEIDQLTANEDTRMSAVPLMYWRAMISGKGGAGELQNSRYPEITPETVREYCAEIANGTAQSPYMN